MAKTAERLLTGIKRRVIIPSSQPLMANSDMLALADDVIATKMVPTLVATRQDFFVTMDTTDCVSGTATYDIPYRAAGRTIRDLKLVDDSGSIRDLSLIAIEDAHLFTASGEPHGFYFKGDKVVIVPTPASSTIDLQFWYELMPSQLIETSEASTVSSTTTTIVTVDQVPSDIVAGVTVDFIQGRSGHSILAMDKTVVAVTSTTIEFASGAIPTGLGAGDYIALSGYSPVIMLPDECYPLLESEVCIRILESIGDFEGADRLKDSAKDERKDLLKLLEPRVRGEATKIVNRHGLLRGSRLSYRRGAFR